MPSFVGKRLAQKGYLPRDIPPAFSSESFGANFRKIFNNLPKGQTTRWTKLESFSLPRSLSGRRVAGIVNPIPFLGLSEEISKHWKEIRKLYNGSKISFSVPKFGSSLRSIQDSDFRAFRDAQITQSAGYSHVLYADYSRYFPTIYTHSLEWAVHGKSFSKSALGTKGKGKLWASVLDKHIQAMQEGQTQGIPIGPDTSYIVAELLGSAIDAQLAKELGKPLVGARLIDDYVLYFGSRIEAERAQSKLHLVARDFQVELNPEKTRIDDIFCESREAWTYKLADFERSTGTREQRKSIIRYTDHAINLFHEIRNPAIGRYAVKVISGSVIHPDNIDVALACVMRLGQFSPASIQDVAKFCVAYHLAGFSYSKPAVSRYVNQTLYEKLDFGHDCEASWVLWMATRMNILLTKQIASGISKSTSSVVLLLGKLAEVKGLTPRVTQSVLPNSLNLEDFTGQNWLLAYEGAMKGWFGWNKSNLIGSSLELLASNEVEFLNDEPPEHVIVKPRAEIEPGRLRALSFDELDELFEAEVEKGGYDMADYEEDELDDDEDSEFDDLLL